MSLFETKLCLQRSRCHIQKNALPKRPLLDQGRGRENPEPREVYPEGTKSRHIYSKTRFGWTCIDYQFLSIQFLGKDKIVVDKENQLII